ncbi:VOC family protein [Amorphus coralli]|uniref:VOC family protein n=1 Tax=Amorphus coralli TaxID=340680 RepID=UPI000362972B|nr:VOC family protein [Amorphus coralli]
MASTTIPTMRYADAVAMIDWLCSVIGFERHLVVEDGDGGIAHAQLVLGDGMIMLGSARDDPFDAFQTTPAALGRVTQSAYLVVTDVDGIAARAQAGGARIAMPLHDPDHGGRACSFFDPEGHLWNIGTYDPWT